MRRCPTRHSARWPASALRQRAGSRVRVPCGIIRDTHARGIAMLVEHRGKGPTIHESAFIAPNATICGDVTIGPNSHVLFGAVITAAGGAVEIGSNCVIMENAILRGTRGNPLTLGDNVLVGPHAHLTGCTEIGRA